MPNYVKVNLIMTFTIVTPSLWKHNGNKLVSDTDDFVKQPDIERNKLVSEILETGIQDDEAVLAGCIRDYTHNKEIFGFFLSYLDLPGILPLYAVHRHERNSRYFLQRRVDFIENMHYNITLHHNGVESFKDSNISCGLSKTALDSFGWSLSLSRQGFILHNSKGEIIGHQEYYYAFRSIGNQYPSNQPYLQRWIIKQNALDGLKPWHICTVVDSIIEDYM